MEGGCACGGVRYALTAEPMFVHCCHCKDCQRQTGSAFVLNALIEANEVELRVGAPAPSRMPTDSGRPHDIWRCAGCGTAVWSTYGGVEAIRFVRVGTLDEPGAVRPDVHIYTRSKQPWLTLPSDAPAFAEYYSSKAQWPAESLARRAAALGK